MIDFASIELCILDNLPLNESPCYRTLCEVVGERRARQWVDEVVVDLKHPPPGVSHDTLRDDNLDRGSLAGRQSHDGSGLPAAPWPSASTQASAAGPR